MSDCDFDVTMIGAMMIVIIMATMMRCVITMVTATMVMIMTIRFNINIYGDDDDEVDEDDGIDDDYYYYYYYYLHPKSLKIIIENPRLLRQLDKISIFN